MSENARKRTSKWDLMAETNVPTEGRQGNAQPAKAGDTSHDMSNSDCSSSKSANQFSKWPDMDVNNTTMPKDSSESYQFSKRSKLEADNTAVSKDCSEKPHFSKWSDTETDNKNGPKRLDHESISGKRTEQKDGNVDKDSGWGTALDQSLHTMKDGNVNRDTGWSTALDQSHRRSMSPGLDEWQRRSRSISPKSGWSRSHRSRSQSWSRSRSRSRSPSDSFRREAEGWNDRNRMRMGGSRAPCRDFAVGRCRRGSQCRYLHEDGGRRHQGKHYDCAPTEIRESRYERDRSAGYDSRNDYIDSVQQRDYPRDKIPDRHGNHDGRDWENYEVNRNSRPTVSCFDFTKGRCHRGSACKYVHHNASSDGGWHTKERIRDRSLDRGDADTSFRHDQKHEFRRVSDTPCKFFAEGRCRNGETCRFSHQGQVHIGMARDEKRGHSSNTENRSSWEGPKWPGKVAPVDQFNSHQWSDARGVEAGPHHMKREESGHNRQDLQSQHLEDIKYQVPKEAPQTALPVQEHNTTQETSGQQPQYGLTFSTQPVIERAFVQQQSGFKGERFPDEDGSMVTKSSTLQKEINFYATNVPPAPGQSFNQGAQSQYVSPQPPDVQNFTPTGQRQEVAPPASLNEQSEQQIVYSLPLSGESQFVSAQTPSNVQSFNLSGKSQHIAPPLKFSGWSQQVPPPAPFSGQNQQIIHSMPPNGPNQYIALQLAQNVPNFNPNAQSQQIPSQPPKLDLQRIQEESPRKIDTVETIASSIGSDNAIAQKLVTSEEVAQITNLSASLAQIFGNGQQLPQLYASLNPINATGSVLSHPTSNPSSVRPHIPAAAPYIQPNQEYLPQQQYDAKPDNTEPVKADISNMPPGFTSDSVEEKNTDIEELQAPLKTSGILSVADGHKDGNPCMTVGLEEKLDLKIHESKQVEMSGDTETKEVNEIATCQSKKEQLTAHSEDVDADVRTDGESKGSKDSKGIRMFKFSLVELVKDILKPTWKEGQMSKEAHKTIVKKVVDKVTGALPGPNIPQTQEKIDLYLSYSKPKLSKLVQAYVEKYAKI